MLEWDAVTRHWWRYDKDRLSMVHRVSGETVAYRSALPEANWHRFEYMHGDTRYPLLVEIKSVSYPNPDPEALNRPPWNSGGMPYLRRQVWHIDHERSLRAWQIETSQPESLVPYWLWRRVDIAVSEAGLLWPEKLAIPAAQELAINAGWANGKWQEQFYRRIYWQRPLYALLPGLRIQTGTAIALPLSDHALVQEGAKSLRWRTVEQHAISARGVQVEGYATALKCDDGTVVALPVDSQIQFPGLFTRPITTIWDNWFLTTAFTSTSAMVGSKTPVLPSGTWEAPLNAPAIVGAIDDQRKDLRLYGKPVVAAGDDFVQPREAWSYDGSVITHPLSSYPLWRQQYEIRLNALTFCSGFDAATSTVRQGEFGTLNIAGGYIGGIQGMHTQARLSRTAAADDEALDWQQFF